MFVCGVLYIFVGGNCILFFNQVIFFNLFKVKIMKKHFTNFIYTLLVVLVGTSGLFAQNDYYIWGGPGDKNSEFDGGLNDWTVNAVSPNENALWVWEADGKADRGAYSGKEDAVQIQSPSVDNGAAVFDSDFYDNGGTAGEFGKGIAPSPQVGELISPVFSCENESKVIVKFNQYHRNYKSTCKLAVSVDGGQSYVKEYELNADLAVNEATKAYSSILTDISEVAANQAQVRLKFVFDADYYLWIIDDVYVMRDLPADPRIMGTWFPSYKYKMPKNQVTADSFYFVMAVKNLGLKAVNSVKAKVSVVNEDLDITYYEDEIENILESPLNPNDSLDFIQFKSWMPTNEMKDGVYYVSYQITTDEEVATQVGKEHRQYFVLNPNTFEEVTEAGDSIFSNIITFGDGRYGNAYTNKGDASDGIVYNVDYFKMSDWPDNEKISIGSNYVNFTIAGGGDSYQSQVSLFELADTIDNQLTNFNLFDGISVDNNPSTQLTRVGYSSDQVNGVADFDPATVTIYSENDNGNERPYVKLKPNKKYFLVMKWGTENEYFQGFDKSTGGFKRFYYLQNLISFVYMNYKETGESRFFYLSDGAWDMELGLVIGADKTATKDELLPDNSVTFLGNPTKENLNVAISLENAAKKASMVISDINGRVIDMKTVYNLKDSNERFYVGNLPNGTYIFTLFTKDKFVSKKFVVAK